MNELQKEIVKAFAETSMNTEQTAKKMYRHRNTICYHLERIHEVTGLDPKNFFDLIKLYELATKEDE